MKTTHDSETPLIGQQVITACAFIYYDFTGTKKLFLPRRALTKKFLPGVYELPGGHIEFGEDITVGLKRELEEELHIEVRLGDPFAAFTYLNKVKGAHAVEIIYFAELTSNPDTISINLEDHSEYLWIQENEISRVTNNSKSEDDKEIAVIKQGFRILANPGNLRI